MTPKRCLNIPEAQSAPYTAAGGGISATKILNIEERAGKIKSACQKRCGGASMMGFAKGLLAIKNTRLLVPYL